MVFLIAILMLGLIVFVHELGHFFSAKFFGIPISEFSIGMGPQVFSAEIKNTMYSFRAIPIGGYVNIEGMEIGSEIESGFNTKPAYQRIIILAAGVIMNFITAFLILIIAFKLSGKMEIEKTPIIGNVAQKSLNLSALKVNDKILKIENYEIKNWKDISTKINLLDNDKKLDEKEIQITIEREEKQKKIFVKLKREKQNNKLMLGINPIFKKEKINFSESLFISLKSFKEIFNGTLKGFVLLFGGKANFKDVTGPVGIFKAVGEMVKFGWFSLAYLAAVISINIGLLNLFPIPALDGGRIIFVILEFVGIKVNKKWEERIHKGGMTILFFLIFVISMNDILKIFK